LAIPGTNFSLSFKPVPGCPWALAVVGPSPEEPPLWAAVCDSPPVGVGAATVSRPPVSLEGGYTLQETLVWRTDGMNISAVGVGGDDGGSAGTAVVVVTGTLFNTSDPGAADPTPFTLSFSAGATPSQVNVTAVVEVGPIGGGGWAPNRLFLT
jgi:hypothetical protein